MHATCTQVLFNFATALNPASPTFSEENLRDVRKRPSGAVQKPNKVCAELIESLEFGVAW